MRKLMSRTKYVVIFIVLCSSCAKLRQNKGQVASDANETVIDFFLMKNLVIVPLLFNGVAQDFILDGGDELTTISRKELQGRISKVGTATGEKTNVGRENVQSIKIGDRNFQNISAQNLDLSAIKKDVPNFGGLIGQSILSKANWLIDYPNKKLTISQNTIATNGFISVSVKNMRSPYLNIEYDGITYKAFVDLGSSTAFSVKENSKLGQALLKNYSFTEEEKTTTTAGGTATAKIKRGEVSSITINGIAFNTVNTILTKVSSHEIRIGMSFFKDKMLYLDYTNKQFKIK